MAVRRLLRNVVAFLLTFSLMIRLTTKRRERRNTLWLEQWQSTRLGQTLQNNRPSLGYMEAAEDANAINEYMADVLNWSRPTDKQHWPPYENYVDKGFDPNRWEAFDVDNRIYESGLRSLESADVLDPLLYRALPDYNSHSWKARWHGEYVPCIGPRGVPLGEDSEDIIKAYGVVPVRFPRVYAGSYELLELDEHVCFDRYSRYGAYGLQPDAQASLPKNDNSPSILPNWSTTRWGQLQEECLEQNKARYKLGARISRMNIMDAKLPNSSFLSNNGTEKEAGTGRLKGMKAYQHRTAVLIRSWTGYKYEENDIMSIRALITELSLSSGGEFTIILFVQVKDSASSLFSNQIEYDNILEEQVPKEFHSITIFWSESLLQEWYPNMTDWQVYWHQFMSVQWFAATHPEFEYVWNWEMDVRYIGHHYHFLNKISAFADKQPRKFLWERNKRFFIPSIHGSYDDFVKQTQTEVLSASAHGLLPPPIWGAQPWAHADPKQIPLGPPTPTSFDQDNFTWGVNEPADLITLLPIFSPHNTSWSFKDKIWNYIPGLHPVFSASDPTAEQFTHPVLPLIPRRVSISTVCRLSKQLLHAMHRENRAGRAMASEMFPASVALQHGLKAVYAPHPIYADRVWPARYSKAVFDTAAHVDGAGAAVRLQQGSWTEGEDSPYNHDREYNFYGWSWYYAGAFGRKVYRAWLGWGSGDEGGGGKERKCVKGMLLHPVKKVREDMVEV